MLVEKLCKVFRCNACVDVVINLNGYAYTVAFADAQSALKGDFVLKVVFCHSLLQKKYNVL